MQQVLPLERTPSNLLPSRGSGAIGGCLCNTKAGWAGGGRVQFSVILENYRFSDSPEARYGKA